MSQVLNSPLFPYAGSIPGRLHRRAPLPFLSAHDSRPMMVKPLDVPCRYCKAEPGEGCTRWRKRRGNKYRTPRSPHPDRVYDAQCASDAAQALSGDEQEVRW